MNIGAIYEGEVGLWVVEIEGRGGDSVHDEYFKTEQDAIMASAIDGENNTPRRSTAMKFSDGSYMKSSPVFVQPSPKLDKETRAKILGKLTQAQRILFGLT
jgi:hypothetical protein